MRQCFEYGEKQSIQFAGIFERRCVLADPAPAHAQSLLGRGEHLIEAGFELRRRARELVFSDAVDDRLDAEEEKSGAHQHDRAGNEDADPVSQAAPQGNGWFSGLAHVVLRV